MKTHIKNADVPLEKLNDKMSRKIMGYDSNLMLVRVLFKKGGVGSPHAHPHQQVSYVEKGKFEVTIGDKTEVLVEGDAFVVPSNILHGAVCLEEGVLIDTFSPMREDFIKK
ncbi:MAG: cupin domain-containing protein [Candidatus Marinimicrobia bacterium]|nr:cupin domain-containing protein [Candidatus Neomarinimicrobiota bacterium]